MDTPKPIVLHRCRVPVGDIIIHMMREEIAALNGDLVTVESMRIQKRITAFLSVVRDYVDRAGSNQEDTK